MRYVFGDYSLDTQRYELRRAGELIPLGPQVFDILIWDSVVGHQGPGGPRSGKAVHPRPRAV